MGSSMVATMITEETITIAPVRIVPAFGPAKWEQVRRYLSRAEQGHLDDNDIGPECAWRMCRSYRNSQAEVPSE